MHDSSLDFLEFIIVLSVVVAIGINLSIPTLKKAKEISNIEFYDKTVSKIEGDLISNQFQGTVSNNDIVLEIMTQGYFLPKPGKIDICGTVIDVSNNLAFSPKSMDIGVQTNTAITNWFAQFNSNGLKALFVNPPATLSDAKFKIMFSMNNPDDETDDTYSLYIMLKKNSAGEDYAYYKCISGGRLEDRRGNIL